MPDQENNQTEPRKTGAPLDNVNHLKHGQCMRRPLVLSRLPADAKGIVRKARRYRRLLEEELEKRGFELDLGLNSLLTEATESVVLQGLCYRAIANGKLTSGEQQQAIRSISNLSQRRNLVLKQLGLVGKWEQRDPLADLVPYDASAAGEEQP